MHKKIIQFVYCLNYGDGLWYYLLNLQKIFLRLDFQSEIYIEDTNCKNKYIKNISEYKNSESDILILHYTNYFKLNNIVSNYKNLKILDFHNVTPPEFFKNYSSELFEQTSAAYNEFPKLINQFDCIITHSNFSKNTLLNNCAIDEKNIYIIPLLLNLERYKKSFFRTIIKKIKPFKKLLFVSRIFPNKRQDLLIETMNILINKYHKHNYKLFIIGGSLENYYNEVIAKIKKYNLENFIVITDGIIDENELYKNYQTADIFICPSEHEGFCAPVVETANYNIPIIAYNQPAVRETLLDNALFIENNDPQNYADAILSFEKNRNCKQLKISSKKIIEFHKRTAGQYLEFFNNFSLNQQ